MVAKLTAVMWINVASSSKIPREGSAKDEDAMMFLKCGG
jgi:hypothetical protein